MNNRMPGPPPSARERGAAAMPDFRPGRPGAGPNARFHVEKPKNMWHTIDREKKPLATLPASYDDLGEAEHLLITLYDKQYDLTLEMHYYVYAADNVITKTVKLINSSKETVKLNRLLSNQLDLPDSGYKVINFT